MNHDPDIFDNPDEYRPERYTEHHRLAPHYAGSADYDNRDHYTYGAGRRICPGTVVFDLINIRHAFGRTQYVAYHGQNHLGIRYCTGD